MNRLKIVIDSTLSFYSKWKLFILAFFVSASLGLGFILFGPFITSDAYEWYKTISAANPLVSEFVDVQGMIADKLIASTVPLFTVWTLVLGAYCLDKNQIRIINESSKYLAFFTGSTALIVLCLGGTLLGICLYGLKELGYSHAFLAATVFAVMVVGCGFLIKSATRPELKENSVLNKLASSMLVVCFLLAISAYVYGLVKDPILYWNVIHEACQMANKCVN
ncbi:hypothetical protein [Shewanella halotolerans]|uniref:hypothetical protein n=1 Tax=Shewanella halotolerans TaxID=2864204 RepID=UPI001C65E428|nr:hypothetical protein [Shewanella halotolerans]QYJ88798.1 hypothetical protein K0H81_13515 [Shewanella halotolerans]